MPNQEPERDANGNFICYGKHWDANAVPCKGGMDPAHVNPDGTNLRPRCDWFSQCASTTVRNNLGRTNAVPPPATPMPITSYPFQSIVRGVTQGAATALVRHVTQPTLPVVQQPQYPIQVPQPQYGYPAPVMVHPAMAAIPYMSPMNYQAPGMQMPAYLSVQEPIVEGQHWGVRLFFNIARAMLKAGAHTTANFVDHTCINRPVCVVTPPGSQTPQQG